MSGRARWAEGRRQLLLSLMMIVPISAAVPPHAHAPPSNVNGWDNAYSQILTESLRRAERGKWVYTSDGHAISRITDVHTAPYGMHVVAVVRVRRLLGGGIALPVYRLSRRKGRIVSAEDLSAIRAMAHVDVAVRDGRA
ncbi:hypothetical protein [Methylobacterium sp. WSM2598]|uniref:hypothetical protein n=1 Tax=Methylobacterium sp. WSM2598 TaxID=398261 RepID=UPI00037A99D9|nr:hypothetical protein [Methylobacterium sp. WSM2598]